jgi:TrmH family RNA methyltransferase
MIIFHGSRKSKDSASDMSQLPTNNQLKIFSSLKLKKFRRQHGLFIADGLHLVQAALNSAWQIEAILIESDKTDLIKNLSLPSLPVIIVPKAKFARISPSRSPQGVLAIIKIRKNEGEIERSARRSASALTLSSAWAIARRFTILKLSRPRRVRFSKCRLSN